MHNIRVFTLLCLWLVSLNTVSVTADESDEDPVKKATSCEVCKYLATELKARLEETGKSKEVLETGHSFDKKKKRVEYQKSELRLIEALQEPHICDKLLKYKVHKEKKGSLRFDKSESETMQTLHGLKDKGVKVDLGIPEELWDTPSAEVTDMHRKCFKMVEEHEEDIEDWYFHKQDQEVMDYLCAKVVLGKENKECLYETPVYEAPKLDEDEEDDMELYKIKKVKRGNSKGDRGSRINYKRQEL